MGGHFAERIKTIVEVNKYRKIAEEAAMAGMDIATAFLFPRIKLRPGEQIYLVSMMGAKLLRKGNRSGLNSPSSENCLKIAGLIEEEAERRRRLIEKYLPGEEGEEARKKFPLVENLAHRVTSYWVQLNDGDGSVRPSRLTEEQKTKTRAVVDRLIQLWPEKYLQEETGVE